MAKIGVFDSGVGGQSVATAIGLALPDDDVIFVHDHENVPYGTKTADELFELSLPKLRELAENGSEVIVIACNSVSTTILDRLKSEINVPLIGVEPMVGEAARQSKNKVVAVCATPLTLASERYRRLRLEHANPIALIEPDCSEWAYMIEQDMVDRARVSHTIEDAIEQGADVIVLGCTHYHWIESLIKSIAGNRAVVLQPEQTIIGQVKQVLGRIE